MLRQTYDRELTRPQNGVQTYGTNACEQRHLHLEGIEAARAGPRARTRSCSTSPSSWRAQAAAASSERSSPAWSSRCARPQPPRAGPRARAHAHAHAQPRRRWLHATRDYTAAHLQSCGRGCLPFTGHGRSCVGEPKHGHGGIDLIKRGLVFRLAPVRCRRLHVLTARHGARPNPVYATGPNPAAKTV